MGLYVDSDVLDLIGVRMVLSKLVLVYFGLVLVDNGCLVWVDVIVLWCCGIVRNKICCRIVVGGLCVVC